MPLNKPYPKELRFNYRDYRIRDEGKRWELIDGDFHMVSAPFEHHQRSSRNLEMALWQFVRDHDLGQVYNAPFDVILSDEDVVQPDIVFIRKERMIHKEGLRGAPDLVIEILSPSSHKNDRIIKKKLYSRHHIAEYWIVDPDAKTVDVHILSHERYKTALRFSQRDMLTSALFPGLKIPVKEIFSR